MVVQLHSPPDEVRVGIGNMLTVSMAAVGDSEWEAGLVNACFIHPRKPMAKEISGRTFLLMECSELLFDALERRLKERECAMVCRIHRIGVGLSADGELSVAAMQKVPASACQLQRSVNGIRCGGRLMHS